MLTAVAPGVSHPVVAGLLGLSATGLAALVVGMAWSVHARQIRLGELLARRQFIVTGEAPGDSAAEDGVLRAAAEAVNGAAGASSALPVTIDGPDTVVAGDQARYRVRASGSQKVVSWAAGGGSVAQSPDPSHPDELLLVADQPGDLMVTVRVREGMTERRATKYVTAVADVTAAAPPFTLQLFLQGWGLVVVAVMVVGFAGALVALGSFASADFIALVTPLAAVLGVTAFARRSADSGSRPGYGKRTAGPGL
jgi:hypothetical protein